VLTGLLDALVLGFRDFKRTKTPNVRMADFARLIAAAEPKLPWKKGAFLQAYKKNRENLAAVSVEGDAVAQLVLKYAEEEVPAKGMTVVVAMTALYDRLTHTMLAEDRRRIAWPGNARWFSDRLTQAMPGMRAQGVDVSSRHTKAGQMVTVRRIASLASPAKKGPQNGGTPPEEE
jgi:hypothetical protein